MTSLFDKLHDEALPKYVDELVRLGLKYKVPVQVNASRKLAEFSYEKAMKTDGYGAFIACATDIMYWNSGWSVNSQWDGTK